ncbi:hypothetical protein EVAR_60810_1 [Eumeta japonica]|uniref:DUF4795 domain-containing protein n=1 Tax=Eumeta variegata TaxID=151549 RepID=A0A4C1YIP8_EUMVA|nr:hypothetical protein EVAR_60810_1 [Eumeta japonica]
MGIPRPGDPLVTKPLMEQALKRLREELSRAVAAMGAGASGAADDALRVAKELRTKIEALASIDQHISDLHSLVQEYAQQLSGFDDGLKAQIENFQDQLKQTREDLGSGIERLEMTCTNAEKAALVELKGKYEGLQADQEFLMAKHGELTVSRKRLEEDVMVVTGFVPVVGRIYQASFLSDCAVQKDVNVCVNLYSIVQCVENLREQKADRDEVFDGLRDKVNISQLSGLLSEQQLEITKEELTNRLEMCHEKFNKQDSAWRELLKDLSVEIRRKAGVAEMLDVQERTRKGLEELHDLLRRLSVMVGEPKHYSPNVDWTVENFDCFIFVRRHGQAAVLTRRLAKDAYCGVCRAPALMPVHDEARATSFPPLRAKPLDVHGKGDSSENLPSAPEPRL